MKEKPYITEESCNENHYPGKIIGNLLGANEITVEVPGHKYTGKGINIEFQTGNILDYGVNGTTNEKVLEVIIDRMDYFQTAHQGGKFACRENAIAKTKLEEALMWLKRRTENRRKQEVEGLDLPHKS